MEAKMNNIILVPTDFSEVTENAMKQAIAAAKYLKYRLALLHVIDKNTKSQLKKEHADTAAIDLKLEAIADLVRTEHGLDVDAYAKEGDIFTTIAEVAKDIGANMMYLEPTVK